MRRFPSPDCRCPRPGSACIEATASSCRRYRHESCARPGYVDESDIYRHERLTRRCNGHNLGPVAHHMSMKGRFINVTWHPDEPYNALPPLPPPLDAVETRAILKACIPARAALAELKQAGELLPDQGLLMNLLPLLEARDSSEIENILTTTDKLFRHTRREGGADAATLEALRYRTALSQGFRRLQDRPLTASTAIEVCSILKNRAMDLRKLPGTVIGSQSTGEVVYTPPEDEHVIRDLLSNWERFIHAEDDLDPLIKMAISHYQFEAIHPFHDGNGRTGRVLNVLYLIEQGLLTLPILYLSRYLVQNKPEYYRLLNQVTRDAEWQA